MSPQREPLRRAGCLGAASSSLLVCVLPGGPRRAARITRAGYQWHLPRTERYLRAFQCATENRDEWARAHLARRGWGGNARSRPCIDRPCPYLQSAPLRLGTPSAPLPPSLCRDCSASAGFQTCLTLDSRVRVCDFDGLPLRAIEYPARDGRPGAGRDLRREAVRQGEEALGKIAEELIANPVVNGAIARAFEAREKCATGPGGRDGRAQPPLGGRHRARDPAPALALAAARGASRTRSTASRSGWPASRRAAPTRSAGSRSAWTRSRATWRVCAQSVAPSDEPVPRAQERLTVTES